MRHNFSLFLMLLSFSFCLFSCSYVKGRFWVAMGNYNYARGNYIDAISFYNKGIDFPAFKPWIYYNLGLTYAALSGNESALEMWDKAKILADQKFLFYIHYNEGLVYYYQGLYSRAFNSFKKALQINPSDTHAKVNLEFSLQKLHNNSLGHKVSRSSQESGEYAPINKKEQELLQSMNQNEGTQWFANRKHTNTSALPDY